MIYQTIIAIVPDAVAMLRGIFISTSLAQSESSLESKGRKLTSTSRDELAYIPTCSKPRPTSYSIIISRHAMRPLMLEIFLFEDTIVVRDT